MGFQGNNIPLRNDAFVVRVDKEASRKFNNLCRENGTNMMAQIAKLAAHTINDKKIPFKAPNEMLEKAKDTSGTTNLVFHMAQERQNEFAGAAMDAGTTRQTLIRLYILTCAKENKMVEML